MLGSTHEPSVQHEQLQVSLLGMVPGEQGAHAVTFTPLQFEGSVVLRDGATDGTPGDTVPCGGAALDVAIGAVGAWGVVAVPEVRAVMCGVLGRAGEGGFVPETAGGAAVGVVTLVTVPAESVPAAGGDVGAEVAGAIEDVGDGTAGTWGVAALRSSGVDATRV